MPVAAWQRSLPAGAHFKHSAHPPLQIALARATCINSARVSAHLLTLSLTSKQNGSRYRREIKHCDRPHREQSQRGMVGMAAFDLRAASLHLSQYIETSSSYQNTKTLLQFYDPVGVIVPPNKFAPDGMLGVSELVDRYYASVKKVVVARGCFDDTKGAVLVKNLAAREPSALGLDTYYKQYYLCLAAAAATIKCFNSIIHRIEAEKGVIITNHSLLRPKFRNHRAISFYSLGNNQQEKKSIPHAQDNENHRRDELMSNEQLFLDSLRLCVSFQKRLSWSDLVHVLHSDRVLCHFCFKPKKVTNEVLGADNARRSQVLISSIILLKTALDALPLLSKVLKDAKAFFLQMFTRLYVKTRSIIPLERGGYGPRLREMKENDNSDGNGIELISAIGVGEVIDEDVLHARVPFVARTQQCFAVKAGIDGLLDIARRTFCDTSEAIHNLANRYREEFKLPNLKLPFNSKQGFYFSIPQKDIQGKLPSKFIQVLKHGNNTHCSTLELASHDITPIPGTLCKYQDNNTYTESKNLNSVFLPEPGNFSLSLLHGVKCAAEPLLNAIREDVSALTLLAEVLCLLDMIVNSFAYTISTKPVDRYTRPEFTNNGPLAIDAGRHPILENIHEDFVVTSNQNVTLDTYRSGKSTYLQQVCLVVILAQIGCYVPARFSTIRVVDRIFTRMGSVDNLESNSSTFMTEMKETAFIMQNVSQRSLIIMDELGRATSSSDGFAIAWSCCEHLLSLKAYTIFATHMENLSELATIYPNVRIVHFHVDIKSNRLDFKFQLEDGPKHVPHYGLLLAEVAGLPCSVIEMARSITSKITEKVISLKQLIKASSLISRNMLTTVLQ
ncbi:unnamed protein product [Dovyalis caffra]|uniref:DNA mismatch repair proteins mutS family domain-containing protein n=1 Tax=Dovyalis caffra TaxID=77055 RepID=A0AAV1ST42_9ROSI|nr:unnamed protein product [Dovyalis caffra]